MAEQIDNSDFNQVDRYLKDELSPEEEAAFEERLLDDPELQVELESALAIRETLKAESQLESDAGYPATKAAHSNSWAPLAMAASVVLAVVSTTLYWRSSVETGMLQEQLDALQAPRTSVLKVKVDIMRSSGSVTPDRIIQKPKGNGAIFLDIELSENLKEVEQVQFQLVPKNGEPVFSWLASPISGRSSVILDVMAIPTGMMYLDMSEPGNEASSDRRLLEFRAAQ